MLVIEGSIPNEKLKEEGYWSGLRQRPGDRSADDHQRVDRSPRTEGLLVLAVGTCATYGGIHAMSNNPTGAMGLLDYLGWNWKSHAGIPIVCVPGCPIQPDNLSETIAYLLYQAAGQCADDLLDENMRPTWLFGKGRIRMGPGRLLRAGRFCRHYGAQKCIVKTRMLGTRRAMQRGEARRMDGVGGCRESAESVSAARCRDFPDKFMPFMDEPPGAKVSSVLIKGTAH